MVALQKWYICFTANEAMVCSMTPFEPYSCALSLTRKG